MATDLSWLDPNLAALYLSQRRQQEEEVPPLRNLQFNQGPAQTPSFDLSQSITPLVAAGFSDIVGALGGLGETIGRGLGLPEAFTGTAEQVRINAEEYAKKRIAESPGLKEELEKSIMDSDRPVAHAAAVAMRSIPQMAPVAASIVAGAPAAVVAGALGLETIISAGMGAGDIANQIDTAPRDVLVRDSKPYLKAYNATDPRLPEDQRDRLAREEIKRAAMAMGAATTGAGTAAGTAIAGRGVFSLLERPGRGLVQGGLYGARREAAQEFLQSFGESIGSDITRGQFVDPAATSIDKMLARGFESAIEGAAAGAIAGGAVGVPAGFIQRNMPKTVEELADEKVAEIRKAGKEQRAKSEKETPDIVRGGLRDILATPGLFKGEMPADIAMKIAEAQAAARAQTDEAATQWAQGVETPPEVAPVSQEEYEDLLQQAAQPEPPVAGLSAEDWAGMPLEERFKILAENRALNEQIAAQRVSPETLRAAVTGFPPPPVPPAPVEPLAELRKLLSGSLAVQPVTTTPEQAELQRALQDTTVEELGEQPEKPTRVLTSDEEKIRQARQRGNRTLRQALGEAEIIKAREERKMRDWLARYGEQQAAPSVSTEGIEVTELPVDDEVDIKEHPDWSKAVDALRVRMQQNRVSDANIKTATARLEAAVAEARASNVTPDGFITPLTKTTLKSIPLLGLVERVNLAIPNPAFAGPRQYPSEKAVVVVYQKTGVKNVPPKHAQVIAAASTEKELQEAVRQVINDAGGTKSSAKYVSALADWYRNEYGKDFDETANLDTGAERKSPAVQPATANAATGKQADKGQAESATRSAEAKPEEVKETRDAAQEGKKPEGSKPEREGTGEERKAAETGGGNRAGQGAQGTSAAEEGKKLDWHEWIKRERPGEKIGTDHPDYQKLRDKFDKYRGGVPTKKGEAPTLAPAEKGERTEAQVKAARQAPEKPAEKSAAPAEKPAKKSAAPAEQAPVPSTAEQLATVFTGSEQTDKDKLAAVRDALNAASREVKAVGTKGTSEAQRKHAERAHEHLKAAKAQLEGVDPAVAFDLKVRYEKLRTALTSGSGLSEEALDAVEQAERATVFRLLGEVDFAELAETNEEAMSRFNAQWDARPISNKDGGKPTDIGDYIIAIEMPPSEILPEKGVKGVMLTWWADYFATEDLAKSKDVKVSEAAEQALAKARDLLITQIINNSTKPISEGEANRLANVRIARMREYIPEMRAAFVNNKMVRTARRLDVSTKNNLAKFLNPLFAYYESLPFMHGTRLTARQREWIKRYVSPYILSGQWTYVYSDGTRVDVDNGNHITGMDFAQAMYTDGRGPARLEFLRTKDKQAVEDVRAEKGVARLAKRSAAERAEDMAGEAEPLPPLTPKQEAFNKAFSPGNIDDDPVLYRKRLDLLPDMRGLSTMRANDVQPIIDELHNKWGALKNGNVRIVPVDTYNDLEAGDRLLFTGANAQFDGVAAYNPFTKRVVIIADRIADSNEALKVILHEVKGHYGLRTILGERYYPIMKELYTKNKLIHDLANEHIEFTKDIATATEEALADAAMNENLPKMKGWEKLIAAVRDWLRKFNFGRNLLREFTDNDIRYLLTRASSLVERGELGVPFNVNAQPGTVFSRGADAFTLEGFDKADTVGKANEFVRKVIRNITSTGQELTNTKHNPAERLIHLHPRVMKEALRWSTLHNINQLWGDIFKGDLVHRKDLLESRRTTITNSLNAEFDKMDARFLKWWTDATPLQRHQFMALMGESTRKNLDPRIPFDKHKWLPTTDAAVMAELRGYHEVLWSVYQGLKPSGGAQLFDDLAEFNKKRFLQQHMQVLWNFGKGEGLPESVIGDNPAIKRNWVERSKDLPQAMEAVAAKYAKDLNTENKKQNDMFTDEEIKEANKMLADKEQLRRYRSPKGDLGREKGEDGLSPFDKDRFIKQLRHIRQTYERDNQAPYFHLARHGEYFVSFKMNAEKEDLAKVVATRFREAGIVHFMPTDFVEDEAMMKFDSLTDWKNADAVIEKLKADGYVKKYVGGKTSENVTEFSEAQPRYIEEMIRRIETDIELSKEEKEEISSAVRRIHIDMLPETSIHKALMKREGIAGYDMDMWRAYAERQRSSNYYIGSIATMHEIDDILRDMSTQVQRMQGKSDVKDEEVPAEDIDRRKSIFASLLFSEITRRHHEQLSPVDTPVFDQMRAAGFNYFLAMLPAYLITNLAQPFQLTLPELGSRYGFVKSGQAIARATGKAFKLTKEVVKKGKEEFGWRGVLDALVEDRMLTFLAEDERKVIRDAIDSGKLNFGQATEIGRIASGQQRWRSTAMKIGSVFGYYSEFVNRVTTVLAHYELAKAAGELTADDVKNDTANYKTEPSKPHKKGEARLGWLDRSMVLLAETQFDYRQENIARALGKRGVLGAVTPLVASFHQYQFQYLEKIVREVLNLFDKNERPKAAKFLAGTMGTTMFLAGSLGLPFVSLLSAIVDAIVGDDDEPYDMKTAYRNWLAGVFGKDVAEVLARGMPRAIGVDTSYRMGLQDLMPFSRFLADKRKLEDAWKDHTVEMAGAFFGATLNIGVGASEMLQGDILKGAEKMAPSALKGPLRTAEVGMHGFTNKAGNRLPIEATPWDLLVLSSGFAPSKKAEQSEATFAYKSYERQISQRATLLRNRLATAIERRDMDRYAEVAKEALEFERKTGIPVLSKLEDTVTRRARERAASSVSGVESALSKLPKTLPMAQFANL